MSSFASKMILYSVSFVYLVSISLIFSVKFKTSPLKGMVPDCNLEMSKTSLTNVVKRFASSMIICTFSGVFSFGISLITSAYPVIIVNGVRKSWEIFAISSLCNASTLDNSFAA